VTYHGTASNAICRWCGKRITSSANKRFHPGHCQRQAETYGVKYDEHGEPIKPGYSDCQHLEQVMGRGFFR